ATDAELDASIENYDDVLVLLIADVASNYIEIRVSQERLKYVAENIAIQTELVNKTEDRAKGGAGTKIDVAQMRSNLTDTLALKERLEIGLRLANNRLCILLGIPVRDLIPELGDEPLPQIPPEVVVGIPADVLRRRPDVRRAERQVAAQSARIGIATSNLYPRLSLIGVIGWEAENFGDLFKSQSLIGTIGPSVRWDILNYGRLLNRIRLEDARFQTKVLDYQNIVLRAGREVEDGLVLFLRSQVEARQLDESQTQPKFAFRSQADLSAQKVFDVNRLFVTSNFAVVQQDKWAVAKGDIALGLIQVYKALGGGWEIRLDGDGAHGKGAHGPGAHPGAMPVMPPAEELPPPKIGRALLGAPAFRLDEGPRVESGPKVESGPRTDPGPQLDDIPTIVEPVGPGPAERKLP